MLLKLLPLLALVVAPNYVFGQQNQPNQPRQPPRQPPPQPPQQPPPQPANPPPPPVVNMNEVLRYLCGQFICPRFEINYTLSTPEYDVREYPALTFVKVDAPPPDKNGSFDWTIMGEMFKSLRAYFEGNNDLKQIIKLTAPSLKYLKLVGDRPEPVLDYTAFYLPVSIKPAPNPVDPKVKVVSKPPFKAFVRVFYGCPEQDNLWRSQIEALRTAIGNRLKGYTNPTNYYYSPSYGPQAGLPCRYRRNEIWIVPEDTGMNAIGNHNSIQ